MLRKLYYISLNLRLPLFLLHNILFRISSKRKIIEEDIEAFIAYKYNYQNVNISKLDYLLITDKYFRSVFYLRLGHLSYLLKWYSPCAKNFYPTPNIGGGFYAAHPYSTCINANKVGKNFRCRQCTTIGNKTDDLEKDLPTIGDNVILGANVCIIGNITIGNNVIVGAGSVVVKDVPDDCVVAGNPAKIIRFLNK